MSENTIPLSKTTKFIVDNRGKTVPTVEFGRPLIATNCISNDRLYPAYENLRYISEDTYENWFRSHPIPGDIIITNKGSQNGAICLVPDPVDFVIAQDMVALRADEAIIDPLYLFAVLRSPGVQRDIKNLDVSGIIPHFKKSDFDKLHLPYPDRKLQEEIGKIYFDFCAKIELNRKMNATLEAMARALFQSWFVDFDPVRAKAEGLAPAGIDAETAKLFPDAFQNSEASLIPKSWKISELGQIVDVIDCLHTKKPERCKTGEIYLQLNNIRDDGLIDITNAFFISTEDYQKWTSRMEAIVGDCVITNVGRVGAVGQIPAGMKAALGRNITGIRCKQDFQFPTFLIECLASDAMREEIRIKTDTGTILDALNVKSIPKLRFIRPSREIADRFEKLTRALRERMEHNLAESRTLANMRDELLPKLLQKN